MRHDQVQRLLRHWTLEEFLKRKPPATVVLVRDRDTLLQVFTSFARHQIVSAPVLSQEEARYDRSLNVALLAWVPSQCDPALIGDNLRQAGEKLTVATVSSIGLHDNAQLVYQAYLNTSLLEVIREGFLKPAAHGTPYHRLAVFDYDCAKADPLDAAAGVHVTNIVSQTDIVAFLDKQRDSLKPLLDRSLTEAGLQPKPVLCVPAVMPAINAFKAVLGSHVGCAGVVDLHRHGALVAQVSTSDLRGLLPQHFQLLGLPVLEFLERSLGGWEPPPTSLTQTFGVKSPRKTTRDVRVETCSMQSTLGEVLARVVELHLHRLFVVDEENRPVNVITLTDLLALLVG
ncbi:hypothetical protein N2152v2_004835 [Parachlorella kessleri]